jgi:hypothetical protein
MRLRPVFLAAVMTVAVGVPAAATAAAAAPGNQPVPAVSALKGKPTAKPSKPAKPAKPVKPVKVQFSASGTVKAVDAAAGTVTVVAKGGTKDVKGKTVTISVPSAVRIQLNGARKKLADLGAGFRITITGTRVGSVYTAAKVQATGTKTKPAPKPTTSPTPTPTPTPEPTDTPTPAPTDSPEPDDSASPEPTESEMPDPEESETPEPGDPGTPEPTEDPGS